MRIRKKVLGILFIFMLGFIIGANSALATAIVDFSSGSVASGTIAYDANTGILTGTNIVIKELSGIGTPVSGAWEVQSGLLNFTTGPATYNNGVWTFSSVGSTLTISGGVFDLGVQNQNLLWTTSGFSATLGAFGGGFFDMFLGQGKDEKSSDLVEALGYNTVPNFLFSGSMRFTGLPSPVSNTSFTGVAYSVDIKNQVPEPGTLILLGASTILLSGFARKRKTKV